MHFSTAFASLLAAASTAGASFTFTSISLRSASPVHFQTLQARNLGIWLGGDAATYCPPNINGLDCSTFQNVTAFSVSPDTGTASMSTSVPGGQQLYVGPRGSLRYTQAHSAAVPPGSHRIGFKMIKGQGGGVNMWTFNDGFLACPQGKNTDGTQAYKVYAAVKGFNKRGCLGIGAARAHFDDSEAGAAWQYI